MLFQRRMPLPASIGIQPRPTGTVHVSPHIKNTVLNLGVIFLFFFLSGPVV